MPYAGCLSGGGCSGLLSEASAGSPPGVDIGSFSGTGALCPFGSRCRVSSRWQMQDVRPGADAIALREIHLARQSSLQVPVGHIPVPGGIKLCSPGTFWVANYLIINNSSYQVNFTKPNRATIRYTNSKWPRGDGSEVLVGRVTVTKTGQKTPSPREDSTDTPVGSAAVPKTGQKTPCVTRGWL